MKLSSPLKFAVQMGRRRLRSCGFVFIVLTVFSTSIFAPSSILFGSPQSPAAPAEKFPALDPDQQEVRQALSIAEAQHDKIMVLISQGRFDRVLPEVKSILDLKLPAKYESSMAESACIIANKLAESKQYSVSHAVLDEALRRMKLNENKAAILKIMAFVYKTEGNLDMALQCLERAIELEKQRNRP